MNVQEFKTLINNEKFVKKVQYILIGLFLFVLALDVYLALDGKDGNTVSNIIKDKTENGWFIITYFWGAVAVNLFFIRYREPLVNGAIGSIIIIGIALLIAIFNVKSHTTNFITSHEYSFSVYFLSMTFGVIIGLLFWRQGEAPTPH
ncbi:MAG: hypothetical protein GXO84_07475 [Chlorobi bacterium]|nr:hypothetical protein [Chlorobiota bacterium]